MELKDYSTEELKAELKRRSDLVKAEKAKVKRCRMCKHRGGITYCGNTNNISVFGINLQISSLPIIYQLYVT